MALNNTGQRAYNAPPGSPSSIGPQFETFYWQKKALQEAAKEMYFGQMADVKSMPKHYGKTMKLFHYLPLLDDANINDQGIDAAGASTAMEVTIVINKPEVNDTGNGYVAYYAVGNGVDSAAAVTAAQGAAEDIFKNLGVFDTDYATTVAKLLALTPPWTVDDTDTTGVPESGNLYGSSKDVGYISGKMPALSETGGRVDFALAA